MDDGRHHIRSIRSHLQFSLSRCFTRILPFTMKCIIILAALIAVIGAQVLQSEQYAPIPYSFSYNADTEDGGRSAHQEEGDGNGRVSGSYTVQGEGGFGRVVDYVADENGFRATVRTNEPGTANQSPADVVVESTADNTAIQPALRTAPVVTRPVAPAPAPRTGIRYVLVPITDPRAAGYY